MMTMIGVAQGCQPLISYYYGKKEPQKCKKLLKYEVIMVFATSIGAFAFSCLISKVFVHAFISKELVELSAYTVKVLKIFILSFLVVGYNIVIAGFFTAIEKTIPAIIIALGRGFITLVISVVAVVSLFGGESIWYASVVSELLCLGVAIALYIGIYGRKKRK